MKIDKKDIKIEIYPKRSNKGMIVGIPKGIKLTHIPTGIIIICTEQKDQYRNKKEALRLLKEKYEDNNSG